MTFELQQLCCVLIGLLMSQSQARGYDQQALQHQEAELSNPGTLSLFGTGALVNNAKTHVLHRITKEGYGLYNGNPKPEVRTMGYGHNFVGKRADDRSDPSAVPRDEEVSYMWNTQLGSQFSPGYFHEFLIKRDVGSRSVAAAHFDELLYFDSNDPDKLRIPQLSNNVADKNTGPDTQKGNLWKRIPLDLFSRRTPHYSHSFVGKRSADWESNNTRSSGGLSNINDHDSAHVSNGESASGSIPSYMQSLNSQRTFSRVGPGSSTSAKGSPRISYIPFGKSSAHSVTKRAGINEKTAALFDQTALGTREDGLEASLTRDKLKDFDRSEESDEFSYHLGQDASVSSGESDEHAQPSINPIFSSFREKRPNFGHNFVGKRYMGFDNSFIGKRPQFGHSFIGKRKSFGHSFVGKRFRFGHSFVGKRPQFGHSFVGKRPKFGHSFVGKRPNFGHNFVGKRLSFDESFIEKRPSFGHSFVGKRPGFGHSFIGKRDPHFDHSFEEKRGRGFGHSFVGKRSGDFESNIFNKQGAGDDGDIVPTKDHSFGVMNKEDQSGKSVVTGISSNAFTSQKDILGRNYPSIYQDKLENMPWSLAVKQTSCCDGNNGKHISHLDSKLLKKRMKGFGHNFVGKRENTETEDIDDLLGER